MGHRVGEEALWSQKQPGDTGRQTKALKANCAVYVGTRVFPEELSTKSSHLMAGVHSETTLHYSHDGDTSKPFKIVPNGVIRGTKGKIPKENKSCQNGLHNAFSVFLKLM